MKKAIALFVLAFVALVGCADKKPAPQPEAAAPAVAEETTPAAVEEEPAVEAEAEVEEEPAVEAVEEEEPVKEDKVVDIPEKKERKKNKLDELIEQEKAGL